MQRGIILFLLVSLTFTPYSASTQDNRVYLNNILGVSFQYPPDWVIDEQPSTRTVTASSKADTDAIKAGKQPTGLLFTVTVSNFRLMGVQRLEDFAPQLQSIVGTSTIAPVSVHIGNLDGLSIEVVDSKKGIAARTAILSIGNRRAAVIRGVATAGSWKAGAAQQLDKLISSLNFVPPYRDTLDTFGEVLWQLPLDKLTNMTSLAASLDGTLINVTDRTQGIWQVGATATLGNGVKITGIRSYGQINIAQDGTSYIADPSSHAIWQLTAGKDKANKIVDGKAGSADSEFGEDSPELFAFGARGNIYTLDENTKGTRIIVFNNRGAWAATWTIPNISSIDAPLLASDDSGNVYILGRNTTGLIKLDPAGKVAVQGLGKDALASVTPLAMIVDQAESVYIATADDGILKIDESGKLVGIVGEPFDESSVPKPGQIAKPVALALAEDDRLLYVADSGKHPQIVAFGLNGKHAVNVAAGTRDAGKITYGQIVDGEITPSAFLFTYRFDAKANDTITVTMKALDDRQLDPYIELLGQSSAGNVYRLTTNDDTQGEELGPRDAQIKSFRIRFDGTYTIRATRFGAETTTGAGKYSLSVVLEGQGLKPPTSVPPTAGPSPTPTQAGIRALAPALTPTVTP
jgi:sugar lactone lactonase YvrE